MENYLQHHGILGQKWGIRRYQNSDGTLTAAGKKNRATRNIKRKQKSIKKQNLKRYEKSGMNWFMNHSREFTRQSMERTLDLANYQAREFTRQSLNAMSMHNMSMMHF